MPAHDPDVKELRTFFVKRGLMGSVTKDLSVYNHVLFLVWSMEDLLPRVSEDNSETKEMDSVGDEEEAIVFSTLSSVEDRMKDSKRTLERMLSEL